MFQSFRRTYRIGRIAWNRFFNDNGTVFAGSIAFTALLSLFPFLIFVANIAALALGSYESNRAISALFDIFPAEMAKTLEPVVFDVIAGRSKSLLTVSGLFSIIIASNGVEAIRQAFDQAYDARRPRPFWLNRIIAIFFVFIGAIVAIILGFLIVLAPLIILFLHNFLSINFMNFSDGLTFLRYSIGVTIFVGFLYLLHAFLPSAKRKVKVLWPGIWFTMVVWTAVAAGFSVYLSYAPSYTLTYGTLAGVIVTLFFFYISAVIIVFGAELNAAIANVRGVRGE